MKVILLQDVKKVGNKGDIVEVSEGYGRNFLLPKKYAQEATAANLNVANAKAGSAARKKAQDTDDCPAHQDYRKDSGKGWCQRPSLRLRYWQGCFRYAEKAA